VRLSVTDSPSRTFGEPPRSRRGAAAWGLLRPTRAQATIGLMDVRRLADLLVGCKGKIVHVL
jgi:hypothetical protein